MTHDEFRSHLHETFIKKYGAEAKIEITLIYRANYELNHNQQFKVPAAIDFLQPVAIVTVKQFKIKEIFLAFIDKRGHGHICPEDHEDHQQRSPISNFEGKF
ncbi:MAG: hypothetical protein PHN19_04605 [Patescibacteria group bacterium]|nr:hypothetical protein [Patescibacteria group bacterium]